MNTPSATDIPGFEGELIGTADSGYEEARAVYNAMIDRRPALLARCAGPDDVAKVVDFARENDVLLAVRGGGHNGAGLGTCDGGVVIDLAGLKQIEVDPGARTVRVGGGCTWGEVDAATNEHGLATPSGIISTTGVGGLTLGGGMGHLSRKCGLTIDNLLEAEVVLASGERVRAAADENPDLFWAIRGGGGNFGVVTSFLFRLHEVGTVIGGPTFWAVEQSAEVLSAYRAFILAAPRELNGFFAYTSVPPAPPFPEELHTRKVCGIVWCYVGGEEEAAAAMAPLLDSVPEPLMHGVQPMPFPALQSAFDGLYPKGEQWYWRADFVNEIPDEAVAAHARFGPEMPTMTIDHAPLPDRRRRPRRRQLRHRVGLPRRELGLGLRRGRSGPRQRRRDPRLVRRLLRSAAPVLGRWRLRQHDDGRGPGAGEGQLRRQLRPAGEDQGRVRPGQPLPGQPEHRAAGLEGGVGGMAGAPLWELIPQRCALG